ncbi:MAG: T9SS type A sorting domain-containing protein, partial [Bacteroidota bacterium]
RATYQPEEMRPMISFHGDMDPTVPIDSSAEGLFGSRVLHNALLAQGVCSDLSVGVNEGHGIYRGVDGNTFRVEKASCFFKSIFCNNCSDVYTTDQVFATCSNSALSNELALVQPTLVAYPNPFTDRIQLEGLQGREDFALYNAMGQLIYQGTEINSYSFAHIPKGIYRLQIKLADTQQWLSLQKQ